MSWQKRLDYIHTSFGKIAKLSVENPIDPIVATNVSGGKPGTFVSLKEARLEEHNVASYEII